MAINTLVVLIIGIVILVSGIAFMYSLFDDVKNLPSEVDAQTEQQLFNILLSSKKRIAALYNVQTTGWKDEAVFPIAVQNQLSGESASFSIKSVTMTGEPSDTPTCLEENGALMTPYPENCPTAEYIGETFLIKRYESHAFYAMIVVPKGTPSGEYTFTVIVKTEDCADEVQSPPSSGQCPNPYAKTKIHVNVK